MCNNIEKCGGPSDPGSCKNFVYKWKYEPTTKECETFVWGGCEGNPNNRFNTEVECLYHCVGEPRNFYFYQFFIVKFIS